jgi:hypothetical protein
MIQPCPWGKVKPFASHRFIAELARRDIRVEERIEEQGIIDSRPADTLSRGLETLF